MSEVTNTHTCKVVLSIDEEDNNVKVLKEKAFNIILKESHYIINKIASAARARWNIGKDIVRFENDGVALSDYKIGAYYSKFNSTNSISGLQQLVNKDMKKSQTKSVSYKSNFVVVKKPEVKSLSFEDNELKFYLNGIKMSDELILEVLSRMTWGIEETNKEIKKTKKKSDKYQSLLNKLNKMEDRVRGLEEAAEYLKSLKKTDIKRRFHFVGKITSKDSGKSSVIQRVMDGEYNLCDSQINSKSYNKFDFNLSYSFNTKQLHLDPEKICGVDMGIIDPVYIAIHGSERGDSFGDGGEMQDKRRQFKEQKKRKRKVKKKDKSVDVNKSEKNWVDNFYHNISSKIINFCVKNGAGKIQIEDLKKLRSKEMEKGGKRALAWTPYKLRVMIEYKAKEHGIMVKAVNPQYTSQMCSGCGQIHKNNVATKYKDRMFRCSNCGLKMHPDRNAAYNISNPKIEKIVKENIEKYNLNNHEI